jgi:hypothetical protein
MNEELGLLGPFSPRRFVVVRAGLGSSLRLGIHTQSSNATEGLTRQWISLTQAAGMQEEESERGISIWIQETPMRAA